MSLLTLLAHTPAARAFGWALFHFLWQGAAAALLLALAFCVLRGSRARYAAACVAMLAMVAAFAITFAAEYPRYEPIALARPHALAAAPAAAPNIPFAPQPAAPADPLPWIAPFWAAGVLLFQLRSATSWAAMRRLRIRGVCAASAEWQARVERLAHTLRISKPVVLLETCLADAPMVAGYLKPVILVPAGMLAGLPAEQLEAILLHELAHIARHDFPINLMQTFVEGLLFYHPAVWWVSSAIRAERENCCDDLAASLSGGAHRYAAALTALEETRSGINQTALAANGGNLVNRIRRLLNQPESPRAIPTPLFSAVVLTVAVAVTAAAWQSPPVEKPHAAPVASTPAAATAPTALPAIAAAPAARNATQASHPPELQVLLPAVNAPFRVYFDPSGPPENPRAAVASTPAARPIAASQATPAPAPLLAALQDDHLQKLRTALQHELTRSSAAAPAPGPVPSTTSTSSLSTPYRKWVTEDVAYIIQDDERAAYKALQTDEDREQFIKQFWLRRDPTPGTPENEYKEEHYRRISYTNEHFASSIPGWKTDRGRIYITFGPPDEIEDHSSGGLYKRPPEEGGGETSTFPFQQWRYRWIEGVGNNVILEFVDSGRNGEFRMTADPSVKNVEALSGARQAANFRALTATGPDQVARTATVAAGSSLNVGSGAIFTGQAPGLKILVRPNATVNSRAPVEVIVAGDSVAMAGNYDIIAEVVSGNRVISNLRDHVTMSPEKSAKGPLQYRTGFTLAPGAYTLNIVVKDPAGATPGTSVNFNVN